MATACYAMNECQYKQDNLNHLSKPLHEMGIQEANNTLITYSSNLKVSYQCV